MADNPLLMFPESILVEKVRGRPFWRKIRTPETGQQAKRLNPQFQRLQRIMEKKRLILKDDPIGLQPEEVLVLETIGSVQNFIKAVRKIDGLEWLGELEIDDISPDHGFKYEEKPEDLMKGHLFLVMTDQQALKRLQGYFNEWQRNPDIELPRGLAPFKQIFAHLYEIRPWDAEDRTRETGIFDDWKNRQHEGQQIIPFQAELWFRRNENYRQKIESHLRSIVQKLGGEIVQQCVIPEIAYHGVLGKIPADQALEIISQPEVDFLKCENIMYLRPVGQCAVHPSEGVQDLDTVEEENLDYPQGKPVVALFDGMPLAGHHLINRRIIIDDPDDFAKDYQARERVHGTAMASLICHGDLDDRGESLRRPVYVRPIMKPRHRFGDSDESFSEGIQDEILPIDLVHRAVRRLFESEGDELPVASSVRVINLSICDSSRPFDRRMSAWARLLDWLSLKYNVLFVVSAGNHSHKIELGVSQSNFGNLTVEERQNLIIEAIAADTRNRRLLSPAETINGITVAAIHADISTPVNLNLVDPFVGIESPSTYNAQGPGYRRSIKPDILLPGGRQFFYKNIASDDANVILEPKFFISPPGQRVPMPGDSGELDKTSHTRGTSNASALASRGAGFLYEVIENLRLHNGANLPYVYDAVLIKTLLVHGADWGSNKNLYEKILKNDQNSRTFKSHLAKFLGYGSANIHKVMACTDQRVTVLGIGEIDDENGHVFSFPLPPSLSAMREKRRLTITLAWFTPIDCMRQNYRIAHLWFDSKNNNEITPKPVDANRNMVKRGTVQHEVLEGSRAVAFQDGDNISIQVNCRPDANDITESIRYGLAVTLEVAENIDIPIYQEVRDRIIIPVEVREGGKV